MSTNESAAIEIRVRSRKPTRLREQIFIWSSVVVLFSVLVVTGHISGLAHDAYCHGDAPGVSDSYQLAFDWTAYAGALALAAAALLTFARSRVWYATLAIVSTAVFIEWWILGTMGLAMIWCN
jgi:hypothetical protein